jgi:hypothetical protein
MKLCFMPFLAKGALCPAKSLMLLAAGVTVVAIERLGETRAAGRPLFQT